MKEKEERGPMVIPMSDIDNEARKIAATWVEEFPGKGMSVMPDIAQVHKLASDIMNYSQDRILERTKQYQDKIGELIMVIEEQSNTITKLKLENVAGVEAVLEVQRLLAVQKQISLLLESPLR